MEKMLNKAVEAINEADQRHCGFNAEKRAGLQAFFLCIAFALIFRCNGGSSRGDKQVYVVYMGHLPKGELRASALHSSMLESAVGSNQASDVLVHSYKRSFNGFAARLTEQEKEIIASMDGVVTVFPSRKKKLHTTRSWDFIGFTEEVKRSTVESDIIVGIIDYGLWPESKSFRDEGYGPPPAKFKGICQTGGNFSCNNKVIGAKYYRGDGNFTGNDIPSARDTRGHGTHTASTAAGNHVSQASLFNLAKGTARGAVPSARIAVYKPCWSDDCTDADVLAAFDDAIADGVDIISLSLGENTTLEYFNDSLAIGSFHAMKNGILTSTSAGNEGPGPGTVTKVAPWLLSVAASSIDRKFVTKVKLGNHQVFEGIAINTFNLHNKKHPLVYGGDVPSFKGNLTREDSRLCQKDSLDKSKVKGKIVFCDLSNSGEALTLEDALGTIMSDDGLKDVAYTFPLPTTKLGVADGNEIHRYLNSSSEPTATIYKSTVQKEESAPFIASFSSRGPNVITRDILKPDLSAPGVDILAAWSESTTVTGLYGDTRVAKYNIRSGTSMACPHVTGAAAYVKSFHPTWSPAVLQSALMTTAKPLSAVLNPDAEFAYGSGQIDPVKALDPGLVYDSGVADYVSFLCGQGISNKHLGLITGDKTTCSKAKMAKVWDLNYPSFAVSSKSSESFTRFFHRRVTNVGSASSTYKAIVYSTNSSALYIKVEPEVLHFESEGQTLSFKVKVTAKIDQNIVSGSLIGDDGVHQVRSPIIAHKYA